jgi:hypothetical protein
MRNRGFAVRAGLRCLARCGVVAAVLVPVMVVVLGGSAVAEAQTTGSVTMVSVPGDPVGGGIDRLFDTPGTISMSGGASGVEVAVPGAGSLGVGWTFRFVPPAGQNLRVGEYDDTQSISPGSATAPDLDIEGNGVGCNDATGSFEVKDIEVGRTGDVTSFWALYEQHCNDPLAPPLFGEVKLNEPSTGSEIAEPSAIDWPDVAIGSAADPVPVDVVAGSAGPSISSVTVTGVDAADLVVESDGCTGVTLPAGGDCPVSVAVDPASGGDLSADLEVTDSLGGVTEVPLSLLWHPEVTSVSPAVGPQRGGTTVNIAGMGFSGVTGVDFGTLPAVSYTVDSSTEITAVSPGVGYYSSVDVTVATGHGTSVAQTETSSLKDDVFTYAVPPSPPTDVTAEGAVGFALVSVSPPATAGGSPITSYNAVASPGGAQVTGAAPSGFLELSLPPGTYTFQVIATNAAGSSSPVVSNPATVIAPTSVQLTASPATSYYGTPVQLAAIVTSAYPARRRER